MTETTPAIATPVFRVQGDLAPDLARDCVRLETAEGTEGLRTLQAHVVTDSDASGPTRHLDGREVDLGQRIQVSLGPDEQQRHVFDGTVSGIEVEFRDGSAPVVIFYAEDQLMRLRMTRRMRTYQRTTDAQIAGDIARAHSLDADVDADGATYDVVQQFNQSDLAFLRDRARRIQAELWATEGSLHLATRDRRPGTSATMTRGSDLIAVSAKADLAEQCTAVRVSGYDAAARGAIDAEAPAATVEAEISSGRTGPQTLQRAFGALPGRLVRDVPVAESDARAVARAEMLRRSRRFVRVRGLTTGTPELVVGSRLTLARCGRPFDGPGYYVTRFHHSYDIAHGMRTRFDAERPTVNPN